MIFVTLACRSSSRGREALIIRLSPKHHTLSEISARRLEIFRLTDGVSPAKKPDH